MFGGVERPGPWQTTGDHERRIRALEAACCVSSAGQLTYPDSILAHPCIAHYMPADELTGNLIDRVGGWDLVPEFNNYLGDDYPQYGAAGQFSELPELTAVVNAGVQGIPGGDDSGFFGTNPDTTLFQGVVPFTIELWIYPTTYTLSHPLYIGSGSGNQISIGWVSNKLQVTRTGATLDDPDDLTLDTWHYIVIRYDGTDIELWKNAELLDTAASGSVNVTNSLALMNIILGPSFFPFNGRSNQLAIYNCAISDDTIAAHYALRDTGTDAPEGWVLTSDGVGGFSFQPPTVEVEF
jgi:hypothetical protein